MLQSFVSAIYQLLLVGRVPGRRAFRRAGVGKPAYVAQRHTPGNHFGSGQGRMASHRPYFPALLQPDESSAQTGDSAPERPPQAHSQGNG